MSGLKTPPLTCARSEKSMCRRYVCAGPHSPPPRNYVNVYGMIYYAASL